MASPIWRTVAKLVGTAVISGAGMEAGRRVLHNFLDRAGWESKKDVEQDDELKELQRRLSDAENRQREVETELAELRAELESKTR